LGKFMETILTATFGATWKDPSIYGQRTDGRQAYVNLYKVVSKNFENVVAFYTEVVVARSTVRW
jgi:hypothetical protein